MNRMIHKRNATKGFTLIEVLVTMLILAVGLLGIAALQLKGLQFNHDSALRSQISTLAYDIADRMRLAESNGGLASNYVTASTYSVPATRPTCTAANHSLYVTAAAQVATDRNCWYQSVYDALPPGSTVSIINTAGTEYAVTIGWSDREGQSHNIEYTFVL